MLKLKTMKGWTIPEVFAIIASLLVGITGLAVLSHQIIPSLESNPEARASLTANTLAFYIGALSSVDKGTIYKNLKEKYKLQIGKTKWTEKLKTTKPYTKYYLKAILYDNKGSKIGSSDKVYFYGNLDINCKESGICHETPEITFVTLKKQLGRAVVIEGFESPKAYGLSGCKEPPESVIKNVIDEYSEEYNVDKNLVKAVIVAESRFHHCKNNVILHSKDKEGNPVAFGIMQITPDTTKSLEDKYDVVLDYENPVQNIRAGVLLLSELLRRYENYRDKYELGVGNYNCNGIYSAVRKYCKNKVSCWDKIKTRLGVGKEYCTASDETVSYVERVMCVYKCYKNNPECNIAGNSIKCCVNKC